MVHRPGKSSPAVAHSLVDLVVDNLPFSLLPTLGVTAFHNALVLIENRKFLLRAPQKNCIADVDAGSVNKKNIKFISRKCPIYTQYVILKPNGTMPDRDMGKYPSSKC